MTKDMNFMMNLRRLNNIQRCMTFPVVKTETVASHSCFVSMLCSVVGREYNKKYGNLVDIGVLLEKAIFHDAEEAYISDIPWNVKHFNDDVHKSIETVVSSKLDDIFENCSYVRDMHSIIVNCKTGLEGSIVNLCDMLELAMHCYDELNMGNTNMISLGIKALNIIKTYDEKIINLESVRDIVNELEIRFSNSVNHSYIDIN
jgi:5'-deoxynucleotidase YfbR-like HD superfamily hydrolase